ncbi:Ubiquinone biosynthesis O-methyltransferase [Rubripirellula amarantea]|uniref:Ubiquinone biosynthesis O-methyltransferase n=2 Tax=Rubripirellula amarantea TaxID=2527999 RepID=A0A5C5WR18_9BACT|nr:Ubiquinone biosynthesis O-methyltransferase [Rubripirellula amarantea]
MESESYAFVERHQCPVCNSQNQETIFQEPFVSGATWHFLESYYRGRITKAALRNGVYTIKQCIDCSFCFQSQVLGDHGMQTLYEEWISPAESREKQRLSGDNDSVAIATQVQTLARLLGRPPSECSVLDFGMGWGHWCQMAGAHGYQAFGLELSEQRIAAAQENGVQVIRDLETCDRNFDFVNCEQVLEHVSDPVGTLKTICQILRPGGYTRISVPNGRQLPDQIRQGTWKPSKDSIHPLEHINSFSNLTLKLAAKHAGLEFIRQPILQYPTSSSLGILRNRILPIHLARRSTNLYFQHAG